MPETRPLRRPLRRDGLTIGQIAARTGLSVSAIRYYETEGLIAPWRNDAGQRRFERADIRRLSFVLIAQGLGASIAEIRAQLSRLPKGRTPTAADWRHLSESYRADLDRRIARLQKLRDNLDGCIGCGCLSLDRCALYNPGDRAGAAGPGPRYLMGDSPEAG
ncbi:redox-sensitive transcriptional activator SoxR [Oceanicola sp. S124]|uniref:redox-sensitive transcriptional activator SoxR n=1 Tax=Oceanicola sp. S124 TaxID=1042378 RepID=UPI0002557A21|nr:redox-sensitive transcriptional activator SoxR [Oceanicola sp. S124]